MYFYNKSLRRNAQTLRRQMTPEEKHLWYDFLKNLPVVVKRQRQIENYIIDFYIASAKIAIEIDGSGHNLSEQRQADEMRDDALARLGIRVIRYTNLDVQKRFHVVCEDILEQLGLTMMDLKA